MNDKTKKLVTLAMLCAMAFVVVAFVRIPAVQFLKYEPKDVIIVIGGFLFGPMASVLISVVVSLVEMITISETGIMGLIMNIIGSVSFATVAAAIYQKKRTMGGAVLGLVAGIAVMVPVMLLWNYFVTPLYMVASRESVAAMLVPVFLPFNLIKGGLNAAIAMLLYKPVVTALRKAHLVPESNVEKGGINIGVILASLFVVLSLVLWLLIIRGIL